MPQGSPHSDEHGKDGGNFLEKIKKIKFKNQSVLLHSH